MKSIIRTIIIVVVVAGAGYAGYYYFFKAKAQPAGTGGLATTAGTGAATGTATTTTNAPSLAPTGDTSAPLDSAVAQDFLTQLLNIQSIKIDDSIFTSKAFTTLKDFNLPIPEDTNPGRPNPFAPLGLDTAAISTQVSTSNPSSITSTVSTLNGTLTVADPSAMRWFEYGTSNALGTMTTPKPQTTAGTFAETITGLLPDTTYYVKAAASISGLTVGGNLVTWKTAPLGTKSTR